MLEYTDGINSLHFADFSTWMALGEIGVSLPWWCPALVLWAPGSWGLFLNLKKKLWWKNCIFRNILGQSWTLKFHKVKLMKFKTFNFDLKYFGKWQFFNYEIFLRFKKSPQLPGAGRTRAGHHQRSDMPASPRARNLVVIET